MREYLNRLAKGVRYQVSDTAPSTFREIQGQSTLTVWSGASDKTIWIDPSSNHLFRAWHDALHIKSGFGFDLIGETQVALIQCVEASRAVGDNFADVVNAEVKGQVEYFERFGEFPTNQVEFIKEYLKQNKVTKRF